MRVVKLAVDRRGRRIADRVQNVRMRAIVECRLGERSGQFGYRFAVVLDYVQNLSEQRPLILVELNAISNQFQNRLWRVLSAIFQVWL